MENIQQEFTEKETSECRNSNTEWLLTKCRITKPPPPKPATNPLQFIKVSPCSLFQKAQKQFKKFEEIKIMRQDTSEDAEEWQQNLDNWKSSRRKRQEHIIERVVEVKKSVQEEYERARRKSKTFNEMLEERNKRGQKLNILIYNDDENDLSDYGIISSTSQKSNNVKDMDTDDSNSVTDDKELMLDIQSTCNRLNTSNQRQSENEWTLLSNVDKDNVFLETSSTSNRMNAKPKIGQNTAKLNTNTEQTHYTYEGAIQDYRSRIKLKINIDENFLQKQDYFKNKEIVPQKSVSKINIHNRKEIFEIEKPLESYNFENNTSRWLSEDFINSQSIKERLKNLERCTEQPLKSIEKNSAQVSSVKSKVLSLINHSDSDFENNNSEVTDTRVNMDKSPTKIITPYPSDITNVKYVENIVDWNSKNEINDGCSSPETGVNMDKLNMFNKGLDSFLNKSNSSHNEIEDDCESCIYPASNLSIDLIGLSSDREDSGIHTADVSCSISQADESVDDTDLSSITIPNCIEKLKIEKEKELNNVKKIFPYRVQLAKTTENRCHPEEIVNNNKSNTDTDSKIEHKTIIEDTALFLKSLQEQASSNISDIQQYKLKQSQSVKNHKNSLPENLNQQILPKRNSSFGNMLIGSLNISNNNFCCNIFPLSPPKTIEPPKEKPPPPPTIETNENIQTSEQDNLKRLNSTKRIKKEIHIKRSSFLGLEEPTDEQLHPELTNNKPLDISTFLQQESQLEKCLFRKLHESCDTCVSEVESQDSGLESERGRLSSDTWCSSYGDFSTTHGHQDSEPSSCVISEYDEMTKKEREIIELIEKEEKSRNMNDYVYTESNNTVFDVDHIKNTNNDCYDVNYYQLPNLKYSIEDRDSEVLKVEHELLQLEREELKRRHENTAFRENRTKIYLQSNRHSFDNICNMTNLNSEYPEKTNYRKSMPDLKNTDKASSDISYYFNSVLDVNLQSHKSMPDIQQLFVKLVPEYKKSSSDIQAERLMLIAHRKSMPELQQEIEMVSVQSHQPISTQTVISGNSLKLSNKEQRNNRLLMDNSSDFDAMYFQHIQSGRPLSRSGLQARLRPLSSDNRIQPKCNLESKNKHYDQHWLYQEAELRRLKEQETNMLLPKRNRVQKKQEKHIPDPIIQTLTQRVQNRGFYNDKNPTGIRAATSTTKDYAQHSYLSHPHTVGHASPVAYLPPTFLEDSQGVMLSVSGKKKCSYCNNELGILWQEGEDNHYKYSRILLILRYIGIGSTGLQKNPQISVKYKEKRKFQIKTLFIYTEDNDESIGKRKRRVPKHFDDDHSCSSEDENTRSDLPKPPKPPAMFKKRTTIQKPVGNIKIVQSHSQQISNTFDNVNIAGTSTFLNHEDISIQQSPTTSNRELSTPQNSRRPHVEKHNCGDIGGYLKQILRKQNILQCMVTDMNTKLIEIENFVKTTPSHATEAVEVESIFVKVQNLPVDSDDALQELENFLADHNEFNEAGGNSTYEFIFRAAKKLITARFAGAEFSFLGRKQKRKFIDLKLAQLLKSKCTYQLQNDLDVKLCMQ
ncbi:hypothetical protein FQA39_LY17285 [Lamprigera yunnana]|nr:hypothetical protein FQA39_LY17285 [Lamprigera yunnana]